MRALLDINVLLALFDSSHEHHDGCRAWLSEHLEFGWASCAITQNGFVRIFSQPAYPGAVSTVGAIDRLARATGTAYHQFWECRLSLCDEAHISARHVVGHRQVTDAYLLALAVAEGGRLVTLDRRIAPTCVPAARDGHLVVL